jgi:hypothetical protein
MPNVPLSIDSHAVVSAANPNLTARALISEPYNPVLANSGAAPTAGSIYFALNSVTAGQFVSGVVVCVQAVGVGSPPTLIKVGLYTTGATATKLAESVNSAADPIWTTTANVNARLPFTSAYVAPDSAAVYAAILQVGSWGSTQMAVARDGTGFLSPATKPGVGATGPRMFAVLTGQTDLPASSASIADGTVSYWIALY